MKIIDLYCGIGGWATSFNENKIDITGYDIIDFSNEYPGKFIKCDLLEYNNFEKCNLIVASPPCTDFSKASFPPTWKSVVNFPPNIPLAIKLFNRAIEIINIMKPEYWIIENVKGAQKYIRKSDYHIGSRYLWTNIPYFYTGDFKDVYGKSNISPSKRRAIIRSKIPYSISLSLFEYLKNKGEID